MCTMCKQCLLSFFIVLRSWKFFVLHCTIRAFLATAVLLQINYEMFSIFSFSIPLALSFFINADTIETNCYLLFLFLWRFPLFSILMNRKFIPEFHVNFAFSLWNDFDLKMIWFSAIHLLGEWQMRMHEQMTGRLTTIGRCSWFKRTRGA